MIPLQTQDGYFFSKSTFLKSMVAFVPTIGLKSDAQIKCSEIIYKLQCLPTFYQKLQGSFILFSRTGGLFCCFFCVVCFFFFSKVASTVLTYITQRGQLFLLFFFFLHLPLFLQTISWCSKRFLSSCVLLCYCCATSSEEV